MDMSGMDMGGGGGSTASFLPTNKRIAHIYWYLITALIAAAGLRRLARLSFHRYVRRPQRTWSAHPSRPKGPLSQIIATTTAIAREISYPQPWHASGRIARHFNPPPLGDCLVILIYWAVILAMLWTGVILSPSSSIYAYKWEIVGFRAAWVSVSQIPFIYLLSCQISPVTLITGMSAERLNVFHRWSARTVFLTVIVHWSFFFTEWSLGGIVQMELEMMTMVKYGFGAWAVITWMILSGAGIFRQQAYEIFVLQHIAAAAVLLWLLWVHVPSYATYNVWMSVGFLAFDWGARVIMMVWANVCKSFQPRSVTDTPLIGYSAHITALDNGYTLLSIKGVPFSWTPGQFVYLQFPRLGLAQNHPFTIMSTPSPARATNSADFYIKARRGLTKSLYMKAGAEPLRVLISGPWGAPPDLTKYDTLIFAATSTGISFTLPQLRHVCMKKRSTVRAVHFHWIVRESSHIDYFTKQLRDCLVETAALDLDVQITIHCTQPSSFHIRLGSNDSNGSSFSDADGASKAVLLPVSHHEEMTKVESGFGIERQLTWSPHRGRPSLDSLLRQPIEEARGETAVIGCGGPEFSAQVRNYVANLSDERAVHKGSGAQGIFLHTEHYGV